jgi:hypothetical protein
MPSIRRLEGGSPEEVCATKEIRGAEVKVLSMRGRAGTAASSLAIPRGASSGMSCEEVFSGDTSQPVEKS